MGNVREKPVAMSCDEGFVLSISNDQTRASHGIESYPIWHSIDS